MIYLNPGSHVFELIRILAVTGEFPFHSLGLFGSYRSWSDLVYKLNKTEQFQIPGTDYKRTCRLISISGRNRYKTVRFFKAGLPIVKELLPNAYAFYMEQYGQYPFSGNEFHVGRNHRIAESVIMLYRAGAVVEPYRLPMLHFHGVNHTIPDFPCMYSGKVIKQIGTLEQNKQMYTRITGILFAGQSCYAVYNSRDALMKWSGKGEEKMKDNLNAICRMNAGIQSVEDAIILGLDADVALQTLETGAATHKDSQRFDSIYDQVHFILMNEEGIRILRLLMMPNARETILSSLFSREIRSFDLGEFGYDAKIGNQVILSHLDGDLARLIRFREAREQFQYSFTVLCLSSQRAYLEPFLGDRFSIKTINLDELEQMICKNREVWDG